MLPSTSISWLSIIELNCSFHFFSSNNHGSDIINLIFYLVFTNSSRMLILCKPIASHWCVKSCRAWAWILIHSLFVRLFWIFVAIVRFKKRPRIFCNFIFFSHLLSVWSNWITCINDRPWHADIFPLQIWISVILQTSFVEIVISFFS